MSTIQIQEAIAMLLKEFDDKWASQWPDDTRITFHVIEGLNNIDSTKGGLTIGDLRELFKIISTPEQTNIENNKMLHNAMGLCWHEWIKDHNIFDTGKWQTAFMCTKCKRYQYEQYGHRAKNPNYTEWEHYGSLIEWARGQEWWEFFLTQQGVKSDYKVIDRLLNPLLGCKALSVFLST